MLKLGVKFFFSEDLNHRRLLKEAHKLLMLYELVGQIGIYDRLLVLNALYLT